MSSVQVGIILITVGLAALWYGWCIAIELKAEQKDSDKSNFTER